jgi:hypothetical protein
MSWLQLDLELPDEPSPRAFTARGAARGPHLPSLIRCVKPVETLSLKPDRVLPFHLHYNLAYEIETLVSLRQLLETNAHSLTTKGTSS